MNATIVAALLERGMCVRMTEVGPQQKTVIDQAIVLQVDRTTSRPKVTIRSRKTNPGGTDDFILIEGDCGWRFLYPDPMVGGKAVCHSSRGPTYEFEPTR
jgi:hypothetical protein